MVSRIIEFIRHNKWVRKTNRTFNKFFNTTLYDRWGERNIKKFLKIINDNIKEKIFEDIRVIRIRIETCRGIWYI